MYRLYLALLYLSVCLNYSEASVTKTPEMAAIDSLTTIFEIHEERYGKLPHDWSELSQTMDLQKLNRDLRYRQSYPIQDHYQFITQQMAFRSHDGMQKRCHDVNY